MSKKSRTFKEMPPISEDPSFLPDDSKNLKNDIAACVVEILSQVFVEKQKLKERDSLLLKVSDESTKKIKNNLNCYFKELKHLQMMISPEKPGNKIERKAAESVLSKYLYQKKLHEISSLTERTYEKQPPNDLQDLSYLFKSAYNHIEKTLSEKESEKRKSIFKRFGKFISDLFS